MGFVERLTGNTSQTSIGGIVCDASISQDHVREAELSDHPIEEGSDISDNYRLSPIPIVIEGVISNVTLGTAFPGDTVISSVKSAFNDDDDPVTAAWKELNNIFNSKKIIDIETSLESYASMMLISLAVRREASVGDSLRFTATARHVNIVKTQQTAAVNLATKATAQKKKSRGKQTNKDASAQQTKDASGLAKLWDGARAF